MTPSQSFPSGPRAAYRRLLESGRVMPDAAQDKAVDALQRLHDQLAQPGAASGTSFLARLGFGKKSAPVTSTGLYLHGEVGRGKSMLMDLFFAGAPVAQKRRVHFHEFMLEIHALLHEWRGRGKDGKRVDDLLPAAAGKIAEDVRLLCFDEFHVTNIADAMILGRLFQSLLASGVVIVATSNWPPDELYKGGLQRELFLPFIALIKAHLEVVELGGQHDYRLARLMTMKVYHVPLGPAADRALANAFTQLTNDAPPSDMALTVLGRVVTVPKAANRVAWFGFADLCEQPLAAADYIAIAEQFHTVIVADIPRLRAEQRNEAKRFAILVDTLYEHKIVLIASAEVAPQEIYREGAHAFEFQRTVSRLMEMQSIEYISQQRNTAGPRTGEKIPAARGGAPAG
ncbi:MAG: cell division protein ZapE [Alphaproteobacteria bacterium]